MREGAEDQEDVERDTIAPAAPLDQHEDGEQNDGALGEPLEERLEGHG